MTKYLQIVGLVFFTLLSGCIPESEQPLCDEKEGKISNEMFGTWTEKESNEVMIRIGRADTKSEYANMMKVLFTSLSKDGDLSSMQFYAFTTKLGRETYFNMMNSDAAQFDGNSKPEGWKPQAKRTYIIFKVEIQDEELAFYPMGAGAVEKLIKSGKIKGEEKDGPDLVTETTDKLALFIARNGSDSLFSSTPIRYFRIGKQSK